MKLTLLLSMMALMIGHATCRKSQKTPEATIAVPSETPAPKEERTSVGGLTVARVYEGNNPDSAGTKQFLEPPRMVNVPIDEIPPASTSRRAFLATGWWHFNMAFQATDTTIHRQYQTKWLKFREDQTFDVLINNKVVDTGRWNWDDTNVILYLACHDPYINNTWKIHEKGYVLILIGNTKLNVTGTQARLVGTKTPPPSN